MRDDLSDLADRARQGAERRPRAREPAVPLRALAEGPRGHVRPRRRERALAPPRGRARRPAPRPHRRSTSAPSALLDEAVALVGADRSRSSRSGDGGGRRRAGRGADRAHRRLGERAAAGRGGPTASSTLDPALLRALTEYEEHRLRENLRRGRRIYWSRRASSILSFEEGLAELTRGDPRGRRGDLDAALARASLPSRRSASRCWWRPTGAAESLAARLELAGAVAGAPPARRAATRRSAPGSPAGAGGRRRGAPSRAPTSSTPSARPRRPEPRRRRPRLAQVDQRDGARRHPQARRADEPRRRARDPARRASRSSPRRLRRSPVTARVGAELEKIHKGLERQLAGAAGRRPRGAHGPAAPGLREALARRAPAAPRRSARRCASRSAAPTPSSTS